MSYDGLGQCTPHRDRREDPRADLQLQLAGMTRGYG
jgi:hypothetical protein